MRLLFYSFIMSMLLVSLAQAMQTSSLEDYFENIEVQISQEDDDGVDDDTAYCPSASLSDALRPHVRRE